MAREPILGLLDPDLACAVAAGFVEHRLSWRKNPRYGG
jgi:hypothetical protein